MHHDLIELAHASRDRAAFERTLLAWATDAFACDVALLASERTWLQHGLTGERWRSAGEDVAPVVDVALREGAASDRRVMGRALYDTALYREVMGPRGGTESLLLVPRFGKRKLGLLALGRCGGVFTDVELEAARSLAPTLALAWTAACTLRPELPSLSPTEADLMSYLRLGYRTRDIATARGTSFFTVRNQLAALYRKLDVANRTEAVGLALG